ncbi:MAG: Asp-tRNA(Asn)/Glu-tRNA(Gln) amidotransferase subunit GatA [Acetivibrio sp.]
MKNILNYSATELANKIKKGETTSIEAVKAVLSQIEKKEETLHCYVTVDKEGAIKSAERIQKKIEKGLLKGPLAGVPFGVKDNLCTRGLRTTCSSHMLESFIPSYSAEAVLNLEKAGCILIGKTNMDEFAMGNTTETSYFWPTKNPWKEDCVPGGSSGGSCAAVAAKEAFFTLGSDTGGSIRQPSAYCGVTGLKPTYGTVSRYGLIAYASSFDQIGPIGKNTADCAAVLEVIASYDEKDSTSVKRKDYKFREEQKKGVDGFKIGLPKECFGEEVNKEVKEAILRAAEDLKKKGAHIEWFDFPLIEYAVPVYYILASAEASSNLARFDGVKYGYRTKEYENLSDLYKKSRSEGFGWETKKRILLGTFVLSAEYYEAYYQKAWKMKMQIEKEWDKVFEHYDMVLNPATLTTAPKLGESLDSPEKMYSGDRNTLIANLAGLPAISLPCGLDKEGLPIGMQIIGNRFREKDIIQAAYTYEEIRKEKEE